MVNGLRGASVPTNSGVLYRAEKTILPFLIQPTIKGRNGPVRVVKDCIPGSAYILIEEEKRKEHSVTHRNRVCNSLFLTLIHFFNYPEIVDSSTHPSKSPAWRNIWYDRHDITLQTIQELLKSTLVRSHSDIKSMHPVSCLQFFTPNSDNETTCSLVF